jgi:hypothetical protein
MRYTYYCPTCNVTSSTPSCPTCKRPTQRALRVLDGEDLVEQLSLFDEEERVIHAKRKFRVIRGGKVD